MFIHTLLPLIPHFFSPLPILCVWRSSIPEGRTHPSISTIPPLPFALCLSLSGTQSPSEEGAAIQLHLPPPSAALHTRFSLFVRKYKKISWILNASSMQIYLTEEREIDKDER